MMDGVQTGKETLANDRDTMLLVIIHPMSSTKDLQSSVISTAVSYSATSQTSSYSHVLPYLAVHT